MTKESPKETLKELISWASKKYKDAIIPEDVVQDITWIPTGLPHVDWLFGKGIPLGRLIEFYGKEQSGKTTFSYWLISKVLESVRKPLLYIDAEQSLSPEWLAANGLHDEFAKQLGIVDEYGEWKIVSQSIEMETVFSIIEKFTLSGTIGAVLLDSISVLVPKAHAEIEFEDMTRDIATHARALTPILKRVVYALSSTNVPMFVINQPREKIGGPMFGEGERTPGGRILKHLASIRVKVWRQQAIKRGDRVVGNVIGMETVKNKVAPPYRKVYAVIYYDSIAGHYGFDPVASTIYDLSLKKYLKTSGAWYVVGERRFQGINGLISAAREDEEVWQQLLQISREVYSHEKTL